MSSLSCLRLLELPYTENFLYDRTYLALQASRVTAFTEHQLSHKDLSPLPLTR